MSALEMFYDDDDDDDDDTFASRQGYNGIQVSLKRAAAVCVGGRLAGDKLDTDSD